MAKYNDYGLDPYKKYTKKEVQDLGFYDALGYGDQQNLSNQNWYQGWALADRLNRTGFQGSGAPAGHVEEGGGLQPAAGSGYGPPPGPQPDSGAPPSVDTSSLGTSPTSGLGGMPTYGGGAAGDASGGAGWQISGPGALNPNLGRALERRPSMAALSASGRAY